MHFLIKEYNLLLMAFLSSFNYIIKMFMSNLRQSHSDNICSLIYCHKKRDICASIFYYVCIQLTGKDKKIHKSMTNSYVYITILTKNETDYIYIRVDTVSTRFKFNVQFINVSCF